MSQVITTIIGGLFLILLIKFLHRFGWQLFGPRDSATFFEVTFPYNHNKSAYANEQFLSQFHSLAGQKNIWQRLFGYKKRYSLEIVSSAKDGIRYIIAMSSADAPIIKKNLLSFISGIEIKEISDYLPEDLFESKSGKTKVVEFKLSNDFVLPLKKHESLEGHDPIAYLAGNMTKLYPKELISMQLVITPIGRSTHGGIMKKINNIENKIQNKQALSPYLSNDIWQKLLAIPWTILKWLLKAFELVIKIVLSIFTALWDSDGTSTPILAKESQVVVIDNIHNPYDQQFQNEVKEKLDQPLFEASMRLLVLAQSKKRYRERLSGFLSSLGQFSSTYQSFAIRYFNILRIIQSPSKAFTSRQIAYASNPVLSLSELASIFHFPTFDATKTEDLLKIKSQPLPAPLSFKQNADNFDNAFAKNYYGGTETVIGQTLEGRRRHTYILGATGSGKTTLLTSMIYSDIANGKGVAVLDPHGQLIEKLMEVIPKNRIKDVIWFAPDDDAFPISLNLLEMDSEGLSASQLQKQKSIVTSSIISIMQKFYDEKFFGPRMEYVLRNTILTALETPEPTIKTILDILTKTRYRKALIKTLENPVLRDYWIYEFEKLGSLQRNTVISPITNKIGGILSSPINYNILTQASGKLNFDEIMNSGKILLCDLSKGKIGEDESSFFGSLVISKIQLAALKRALIPEAKRKDFYLYIDEFQNFATETFSELVSEARKYRLSTILAHQSISQIENRDIIKIILANVGTVICFKTANPEDEQFILPIFSPEVSKHQISNLPLYNFYMKVSVGKAEDTLVAQADNFTVKGSDKIAKAVIEESRKRYASEMNQNKQPEIPEEEPEEVKPEKKKQPKQAGLLP
ncbi:MAG: AAA-like domain protein [bacterium ADurb.BinA186]|nr:MAG: AAA-like domain protein [bacterium ADurb.BinA186]